MTHRELIEGINFDTRTQILGLLSLSDQRNMALGILDKDMDKLDAIGELLYEGNRRKDLVLATEYDKLEELFRNNFNN